MEAARAGGRRSLERVGNMEAGGACYPNFEHVQNSAKTADLKRTQTFLATLNATTDYDDAIFNIDVHP